MWRNALDVYTKCQIDISKHIEKKHGKLLEIPNAPKYNHQNCANKIFPKNGKPIKVPNLKELSRFMRPLLKRMSLMFFCCKVGQSDPIVRKLTLSMSCYLLSVYTKFRIDFSTHFDKKLGKIGQTDGQTDIATA